VSNIDCLVRRYRSGDWSVHRGATVEIVDSSGVEVKDCKFEQIGGNGVLLSNDAAFCEISGNEFVQCGDSAVVSVGSSVGIVGTKPTFPHDNLISKNHMHEIGVWGKQTSVSHCSACSATKKLAESTETSACSATSKLSANATLSVTTL
jgi:hypothetical protein